ncbi:unnamed protein product, partial [Iphiclides podalirius]
MRSRYRAQLPSELTHSPATAKIVHQLVTWDTSMPVSQSGGTASRTRGECGRKILINLISLIRLTHNSRRLSGRANVGRYVMSYDMAAKPCPHVRSPKNPLVHATGCEPTTSERDDR